MEAGGISARLEPPCFYLPLPYTWVRKNGWRYAIIITGLMAIIYGGIYFFSVSNTPKGSTYFRPKKMGAMEVSSKGDLLLYILMNIPMYLALAIFDLEAIGADAFVP